MASKTLIGGTAYDILGGKTLVSGTSYAVKNGKALVGGTAYDISFILPPAVLDLWQGYSADNIGMITYANGYWIVAGDHYSGFSTSCARIAYATSLDGTWTVKDVWSRTNSVSSGCNTIVYINGYWIACGYDTIAYSTSLDGTWTTITSPVSWRPLGVAYVDDEWVFAGENTSNGSAIIFRRNTLNSGSWTVTQLDGLLEVTCFTYANGYLVFGGQAQTIEGTTTTQIVDYYHGCILYTTSPSVAWTERDIWHSNVTGDAHCVDTITYVNGYWVIGGRYSDSAVLPSIAYGTSLGGAFTTVNLWEANSVSETITSISYGDGCWIVGGTYNDGSDYGFKCRIAYAATLNGAWTTKDLWGSYSTLPATTVKYANGQWLVGGRYYYNGNTYCARLAYAPTPAELGNTE